jgi:two-component system sensor histidine kinase DegS
LKKLSQKTFETVFQNSGEAIVLHDFAGNILKANPAFALLVGFSAAELEQTSLSSLLSEESFLVLTAALENLMQAENVQEIPDARITRKDGTSALFNLRASLLMKNGVNSWFQTSLSDLSGQKNLEENLHAYFQQATRAQEEERKRLAMELHDQTIQDLVVLSRQLDLLDNSASGDNGERVQKIKEQLTEIIQSLRQLSQDLRPATLDRLGLLAALGHLAGELKRSAGIPARVSVRGKQVRLAEEVELMLFRITQEALNNVWKHSGASRVDIEVDFGKFGVKVRINDNGRGFDSQDTWLSITQNGKMGVVGMQERARLINATFSIQSRPGEGTQIIVEAPLSL